MGILRGGLLSLAVLALAGCAGGAGLVDGRLKDCPGAPHCVSSLAGDARHAVPPFTLSDAAGGWPRLVAVVGAMERTTVVTSGERYLHATVASPWRFYTDDLELLRGEGARVDVRSSSRIGYYDFQVNRRRVEELRRRLAEAGVIVAAPAPAGT